MSTIQFENGKQVDFEGTPTPEDVDYVAKQMGITSDTSGGGNVVSKAYGAYKGLLNDSMDSVSKSWENSGSDIKKNIGDFWNAKNPIEMAGKGVHIAGDLASIPLAPAGAVFNLLTGGGVKNAINATGEGMSNTDLGKGIYKLSADHPDITQNVLQDAPNILNLMGMAGGGEGIKTELDTPIPKDIPPEYKAAQAELERQTQNQKIIEDTIRDTTAKYGTPRDLLYNMENRNKTNPLGVISSYGIKAIPKIEPSRGVVNPLEAIDFLHSQVSKLGDMKGEAVELSDKPTQVSEIGAKIKNIIDQQGWTKLQTDRALSKIGDMGGIGENGEVVNPSGELSDLLKSYPDGNIPLKEIDGLKTYETKLSKSYNNKNAGPFELDAHGVLGKAYRQLVEEKTDSPVIKEFNKYIQSHYDAIELLKSLENKTPNGGMLTKQLQRLASEGVGAGVGTMMGGHPILGGILGGVANDTIMGIFNDHFISNPLKRMLIQNMQDVPEPVIQKMLDYIDKTKTEQSNTKAQLLLEAPKEGSPRSTIGSGKAIPVIPNKSIEMTGDNTTAGTYKPPIAPTGKIKGTPLNMKIGEPYTPYSELPIIKLGKKAKKQESNLPVIR